MGFLRDPEIFANPHLTIVTSFTLYNRMMLYVICDTCARAQVIPDLPCDAPPQQAVHGRQLPEYRSPQQDQLQHQVRPRRGVHCTICTIGINEYP